ncbi:phosphoglycerate mutase [Actibacterium mucosum KCTC 23349]|uniref:Phosphoglycerate mutase n=1 Tax=Actibacterium mucosum KCTC 23349 TaxID=1454373 RepID=A0A037ZGY0_9RHOB|nr:histidine phosphatase family protein [Actibacterium mucosum]KAJ54791.1 phosphoglycerate mutase [Actibacterium mucosum KCTC 23349]
MTLLLILVRHAKSSWGDPAAEDIDRPLNKRGQKAAPEIAKWLNSKGYIPAEVVSSPARRTLETWDRMAPHFPDTALIRREPDLYLAPPSTMLNSLQNCAADPVMMLGHNPGIAGFAAALLASPPDHPRFRDYPTCSTLVAAFEASDWAEVQPGSGKVLDFTIPADL